MTDPMPVFTIKAKDRLAPAAVQAYQMMCENAGLTGQASEVAKAVQEIQGWQQRNPDRLQFPDHPHVPVVPALVVHDSGCQMFTTPPPGFPFASFSCNCYAVPTPVYETED